MPGISVTQIPIPFNKAGGFNAALYWATLISATVEPAAPTHVVLTFPSEGTSVATDITATVNGVARAVSSASWTGGVWTVVLESAIVAIDVVVMTFVPSGGTANVINNIAPSWFTTSAVNNVHVVGDSFALGSGIANPEVNCYPALLDAYLRTRLGSAGGGWRYFHPRGGVGTLSYNYLDWVESGSAFTDATTLLQVFFACRRGNAGSVATATVTGKNFKLFHYGKRFYTHQMSVVVDGGEPQVISHAAPSTAADLLYEDDIVTDTYGTHVIEITATAGSVFFLGGLVSLTGNNGVNLALAAGSGFGINSIIPATQLTAFSTELAVVTPKLTIIQFGYNDYTAQLALNTYEAYVTQAVNEALVHGSVIVINNIDYYPGLAIPIVDYNTRLANICTATGATLVDIHTIFGAIADAYAAGWVTSATYGHPTIVGHQMIYNALYTAVMGL